MACTARTQAQAIVSGDTVRFSIRGHVKKGKRVSGRGMRKKLPSGAAARPIWVLFALGNDSVYWYEPVPDGFREPVTVKNFSGGFAWVSKWGIAVQDTGYRRDTFLLDSKKKVFNTPFCLSPIFKINNYTTEFVRNTFLSVRGNKRVPVHHFRITMFIEPQVVETTDLYLDIESRLPVRVHIVSVVAPPGMEYRTVIEIANSQ